MKKAVCLFLALMMFLPIVVCSCKAKYDFEVDLGNSSVYSKAELENAIDLILAEKESSNDGAWRLSTLYRIRYSGEVNGYGENTARFLVDFHTPKEPVVAFSPDFDYTDYQFFLVKNDAGEWIVKACGYG